MTAPNIEALTKRVAERERTAFDAYCRTAGLYPLGEPGDFTRADTADAWLVWQAAWQAALTTAPRDAGERRELTAEERDIVEQLRDRAHSNPRGMVARALAIIARLTQKEPT